MHSIRLSRSAHWRSRRPHYCLQRPRSRKPSDSTISRTWFLTAMRPADHNDPQPVECLGHRVQSVRLRLGRRQPDGHVDAVRRHRHPQIAGRHHSRPRPRRRGGGTRPASCSTARTTSWSTNGTASVPAASSSPPRTASIAGWAPTSTRRTRSCVDGQPPSRRDLQGPRLSAGRQRQPALRHRLPQRPDRRLRRHVQAGRRCRGGVRRPGRCPRASRRSASRPSTATST